MPKYSRCIKLVDSKAAEVPLSLGQVATIDAALALHPRIASFTWSAKKTPIAGQYYAHRTDSEGRTVYLHREVYQLTNPSVCIDDLLVDHRNGNGLDNKASNLRIATSAQNSQNMRRPANNTSGYKGVSYLKSRNTWRATCQVDGKIHALGNYQTPEEAAEAIQQFRDSVSGEYSRHE